MRRFAIGGLALTALVSSALPSDLLPAHRLGALPTISTVVELHGRYATEIISGPAGDMWVIQPGVNEIGRLTPSGKLTEFSAFSAGDGHFKSPHDIVQLDGDVWYLANATHAGTQESLQRMSPQGVVTQYPLQINLNGYGTTELTTAHGELWVANAAMVYVVSLTGALVASYGPDPTLKGGTELIPAETKGPDGNIWYYATGCSTSSCARHIGDGAATVRPGGSFKRYPDGEPNLNNQTSDHSITAGPKNTVWLLDRPDNQIIRTTTTGTVSHFSAGISPDAGLRAIAEGPNGDIWFTEDAKRATGRTVPGIGVITPTGSVRELATPADSSASNPQTDITTGADGDVWYVGQGNIYRVNLVPIA